MLTVYPGPTTENLDCLPTVLKARTQWVLWRGADRIDQHTGLVKLNKIPIDPQTLLAADSTDPATWGTYDQCVAALTTALEGWEHDSPAAYRGGGLGYVFAADDPYAGVDLDHCVDPITGLIDTWAQQILDALTSYSEVTPSGTGLHILVQGALPPKGRKRGAVEMYDYARFFTMTGWHCDTTPSTVEARAIPLTTLWCTLFGAQVGQYVWLLDHHRNITNPQAWAITAIDTAPSGELYAQCDEMPGGWPLVQCEVATGVQGQPAPSVFEDDTIIQKAMAAANGFKVQQLAAGHWQQYSPSQSEADLGFCCELVFWTQDPAQIDRLFRSTGLMRPKWDEKRGAQTYGERTIHEALARQTEHFWTGTFLPSALPPPATNGTAPAPSVQWNVPFASFELTDLSDMLQRTYPLPRWLIKDLIPEGLTFLVGSPKSSKTYLAYSLALSLAYEAQRGGRWLEHYDVSNTGPVIYISLEDDEAESWWRIVELAPWLKTIPPERFLFRHGFDVPRFDTGLLTVLEEHIIKRYHPALIVLDPISYLYGQTKKGVDQFSEVKDMLLPLRWFGKTYHCTILGVDHRRKKSAEDVDIFETTYGSNAKIAVADAILMIVRDAKEITIHARVRRAEDQTLTLGFEFDAQGQAHWTWKGAVGGLVGQGQYGDLRQRVLETLSAIQSPLSVADILAALSIPDSKQTRNSVYQILYRAQRSQEVQKTTRGQYVWSGGN